MQLHLSRKRMLQEECVDGHDRTFVTPGAYPARETVAKEVTLLVFAPHCTSGITRRRRALVWNI